MTDEKVTILADVPGLSTAPRSALFQLSTIWEIEELEDAYLCREGEPAETLYVLADGECDVIKSAPNAKRYQVARLTPGCLFGHVGVVTVARRKASVKARGRVRVLKMRARTARELLRSDDFIVASPFRRALIVALARQLHSATSTTMRLAVDAGLSEPAAPGMPRAPGALDEEQISERLHIARGHL
jgi:CRP-like cAMP-binding protein